MNTHTQAKSEGLYGFISFEHACNSYPVGTETDELEQGQRVAAHLELTRKYGRMHTLDELANAFLMGRY